MKIQRTIPPAAAPIDLASVLSGFAGLFRDRHQKRRLEDELRKYFKVRHVFLVSSGTAALTLILRALHAIAPEKKQVVIPAYTCFSVPAAIVRAGLEVSLCDVERGAFDFDHRLLPEAIGPGTLCVLSSHLFGIPADVERTRRLCAEKKLFLVEDAAQAMGAAYQGRLLGTIGDAGFYSLGRGKNITCGSGGIIVTNDDAIAAKIEQRYSVLDSPRLKETIAELLKAALLTAFIRPSLYWLPAGLPFLRLGETTFDPGFPIKKFSGMKAGLLRDWQKRLAESNRIRRTNADYLCKIAGLNGKIENAVPLLRLPLLVKNRRLRDDMLMHSKKNGMGMTGMYPTAINGIEEIKDRFHGKEFPEARETAECLVTIPTHPLLSAQDRERLGGYLKNHPPLMTGQPLPAESLHSHA